MPCLKLFYFESKGRAELTRWLLAVGGLEYEDVRLTREQWQEFKPKTPFGQMPCLQVDDELLCQGNSIARFVAKRTGLAGKTEMDQVRADMIVDCVEDMLKPLAAIYYLKDEARAEAKKKFNEDQKPGFLEKFEKFLSNNKNGYLVGDGLTWADMAVVIGLTWVEMIGECPIDNTKYPLLVALSKRVTSNDKIADWIAKRPQTDH